MWFSESMNHAYPDSKVHGANMGPTWVLPHPVGPHVGPMNLAIKVANEIIGIGQLRPYALKYISPTSGKTS